MSKMLLVLLAVCTVACAKNEKKDATKAPAGPSNRVEIVVTQKGFEPENVLVPKGVPVTLGFERKTDKTCATEIILVVDDATKIEKTLPLNERVEVTATFPKFSS